jgi:hypothetical protein
VHDAAPTLDLESDSFNPDADNDLRILRLMQASGVDPTDENAALAAQIIEESLERHRADPPEPESEPLYEQEEIEIDGVAYEPRRVKVDQEEDDQLPSPGL